jgi:hypothetical protein
VNVPAAITAGIVIGVVIVITLVIAAAVAVRASRNARRKKQPVPPAAVAPAAVEAEGAGNEVGAPEQTRCAGDPVVV